jgi:hypothetical protein
VCRYSSFPQSDALPGFKTAYTAAEHAERNVSAEDLKTASDAVSVLVEAQDAAQGTYDHAARALDEANPHRSTRARPGAHPETVALLRKAVAVARQELHRIRAELLAARSDHSSKLETFQQQLRRAARNDAVAVQDNTKAGMHASLTAPQFPRPANWKKSRVGQKLAKDERWPAWLTPAPKLSSSARLETLTDDQLYMDQFGAYLSETMLAAMDDVVSEIRVMATLSRQVRRIPIRRLVAEPLVSNWFAKWIATVILKNRALVGKTWHKDTILDNIAKQLDECRAFFYNPQKYGAEARVFDNMPAAVEPADEYDVDEDEDDEDDENFVPKRRGRRNVADDKSTEEDSDEDEEEEEEE